ncbi:DUF2799 domain-containing protein [Kangiella sp. HD9-110m-PIT-SAG07]|nr:DUF2799 domain-containing protein [Kangiella sp. HD9-110m-PIT-SAG07]
MTRIFFCTAITLVSFMSGCATLSETECISGNWEQIGYQDGKSGRDKDYILNHESSCIEYGVELDRLAYEQGRQDGLQRYCTSSNGYNRGVRGNHPNLSCHEQQFPQYYDGLLQGLEVRFDDIQHELSEAQKEHDILSEVYRRVEDEEEKKRIDNELEDLDHDISSLERERNDVDDLINRYRPYH